MDKPTVIIIGAGPAVESRLREALKELASVRGAEEEPSRGLDLFKRIEPAGVIVAVGSDVEAGFQLVGRLTPLGAKVIVVGPAKDPDLILRTMRAGSREYVVIGEDDELKRAVRALGKGGEESGLGSVISVFPAKGGVGATVVACNLAGALQRRGERVCLVDLDLHLGDVLSFLDLPGTFSLADLIANMRRFDRDLLDSTLTRHRSGVSVLAQSDKLEEADNVHGQEVLQVLGFLRHHYDRVIVDGVRAFDELSLLALDSSDTILTVCTQDVPAVRNTQRCIDLFRRMGYDAQKMQPVLNRFQKSSRITPEVVSETVGVKVAALLANDFASTIRSINRGVMLVDEAPRSPLTKDIEALGALLAGDTVNGARRGGFFRTLFGGKKADGGDQRTPEAV